MRSAVLSTTWLVCIVLSACGDKSSPTAPSSAPTSFNGQWSGTTSQGQSISFTVTSDRVTTITIGYNYNGCSGSKTATDLDLPIVDFRNISNMPPPDPYGFGGLVGPYSESDNTQIQAFLKSPEERRGGGIVLFVRPGCGETIALWTATKR